MAGIRINLSLTNATNISLTCREPAHTADAGAAAASRCQRTRSQLQPAGQPVPAQVCVGCVNVRWFWHPRCSRGEQRAREQHCTTTNPFFLKWQAECKLGLPGLLCGAALHPPTYTYATRAVQPPLLWRPGAAWRGGSSHRVVPRPRSCGPQVCLLRHWQCRWAWMGGWV